MPRAQRLCPCLVCYNSQLTRFIHKHFIWIFLACYGVAAFFPQFGLWIRNASPSRSFTLPMLMLALLLINAGLGVNTREFRNLMRKPLLLLTGLLGNLLIPIAFCFMVSHTMHLWHNTDEV